MYSPLARLRRLGSLSFAALVLGSMLPLVSSCASGATPPALAAGMDHRREGTPRPPDPARPELVAEVVTTPPPSAPPVAPTWSTIYEQYFAVKTEGACGRSSACHATEMSDATSAYSWLEQRGYIAGPQSAIASNRNSCLRWFGGNMPPGGRSDPRAADELSAWVAAGAPNN
jgi:hypothetical protein